MNETYLVTYLYYLYSNNKTYKFIMGVKKNSFDYF